MHIEICEKYIVEGGANDFILYEKTIVKRGETKGKETKQRLGYYSKIEHLIRALLNHDIRTSDAQTLQEIQQQLTRISLQCEKAFEASHEASH